MKRIGFVYGAESTFSVDVIEKIKATTSDVKTEVIKFGILDLSSKLRYDVILDRFSHQFQFYNAGLHFLQRQGTRVINGNVSPLLHSEFTYMDVLRSKKIDVPKTAIFPSKMLPAGVNGGDMVNLQYPLDWDAMFDSIGFPADVKSDHSNEFYDCFRVFNRQDFYFIYDMSGTNTLVLQEIITTDDNFRIIVVGNEHRIVKYDMHKAPKDRYAEVDFQPTAEVEKSIQNIISNVQTLFSIDMCMLDIAIRDGRVYLVNIDLMLSNIGGLLLPTETYKWTVEATVKMLLELALNTSETSPTIKIKPATKAKTSTKSKSTTNKKASKKKMINTSAPRLIERRNASSNAKHFNWIAENAGE